MPDRITRPERRTPTSRVPPTRQVLAGRLYANDDDPWAATRRPIPVSSLQRNYLVLILAFLIAACVLLIMQQTLFATIPLMILALLLIAGRFVF